MVVAAVLLIANTIRLAAFSRRRETGIMRLVGASNFYIQLPFILEAAIAGVVGALLAAGGIVLVKWLFIDGKMASALRFVAWVDWADTLRDPALAAGRGRRIGGRCGVRHAAPLPARSETVRGRRDSRVKPRPHHVRYGCTVMCRVVRRRLL